MIRLMIISDDFTGALDTGVKLAEQGAKTRVVTDIQADLHTLSGEVDVLVMDAETRHLPAAQAAAVVRDIVERGEALGVPYIYKKTDSAMRGNIGAELTALLDGAPYGQLPFFPAFPQMNRCTVNGVHYIEGVPVAESVFGADPFEPVTCSSVTELIALQSDAPAVSLPPLTAAAALPSEPGILVFDASSEEELVTTGRRLLAEGRLHRMAGCAGFAAILPQLLGLATGHAGSAPTLDKRLLVLCGSVNPITAAQLDAAETAGFTRLRLRPEQKLEPDYWHSTEGKKQLSDWCEILRHCGHCILDSNDAGGNEPTAVYAAEHNLDINQVRVRIASSLGRILRGMNSCESLGTLLITGGDTLLQCMAEIGVGEMEPVCEMAAGVVLSRFELEGHRRYVISKSGGFGEPSLLTDLAEELEHKTLKEEK